MTSATLLARTSRARRSVDARAAAWAVLRAVLTALALLPYALGWVAGAVVSLALWAWAAMVVGWRDARGRREDVPG